MNLKFTALNLLICCSLIVFVSCSSQRPGGMPKLYPCSVTVTQEKIPLAEATILAIDVNGNEKWSVTGTTDANGIALLTTDGKYRGAPAGNYILLISKNTSETKELPSKPGQTEKLYGPTVFYSEVDPVYSSKDKSPAKITVEKKKNSFNIDAGKKSKTIVKRGD